MSLENLVSVILSVDYLFGAATALAFRKGITGLFESVLGRAGSTAEDTQSEALNDRER